jgi:GntR family transcriptional regulator / MocR family aminotransferase
MDRPLGRPGSWDLRLAVDRDTSLPVFLGIARAIADGARSGRLTPGSRLPGSRELSRSLGVHRNTVLAAYRELQAEGFLSTGQGRGTFIAESLPEVRPRRWLDPKADRPKRPVRPHFAFDGAPPPLPFQQIPKGALALYGGIPDTRLVPRDALARAFRRALRRKSDLLAYGDPHGEPTLRAALAEMLRARRGLSIDADDVLVTRGSQMALALIGRALVRAGDVVAVEALGYQPAWRALAQEGAKLAPVPVDSEGLDVDALAELCDRSPVRAVYVTPHHQFPTTVSMSAARRMALLDLARRKRFAIIEDDYDHEFHYDGRPVLPLASADDYGVVLYVGTLSKVLAPGLRVGYLIAPEAFREAVACHRYDFDRQGDQVTERALAELIEDGELQRHVWRTRRVYEGRRAHCITELREALSEWLEFTTPSGGMALWGTVRPDLPVGRWHARAAERGVLFQPGHVFTFDQREIQRVRLGYCGLSEREMSVAIGRLKDAARAAAGSRGRGV